MGRDKAGDDDVGLAPLSDDELVAWGEELRRATADGPRHLAPRPLRAQDPSVPVRTQRTEPLRATPPHAMPPAEAHPAEPPPLSAPPAVTPRAGARPATWSVRPRGRPLVAEPGISTRPT